MTDAITFYGAGHLGSTILAALQTAGHRCVVIEPALDRLADLRQRGFEAHSSISEAGERTNVSFSCLNRAEDIERFFNAAESDFLQTLDDESVHINCSTIAPESAITFARAVTDRGARYVEAPVSRRDPTQPEKLTFFIGAETDDRDIALGLLDLPGSTQHYLGVVGNASRAKIASNLLQFWNSVAAVTCTRAVTDLGLPEEDFRAAVLDASGASWSIRNLEFLRAVLTDHPLAHEHEQFWEFILKDPQLARDQFGVENLAGRIASLAMQLLPEAFGAEQSRLTSPT